MTEKLIALGANLPSTEGNSLATLRKALEHLQDHPDTSIDRASCWYRTPAVPAGSGPDFVNGAAALITDLSPTELLSLFHEIESALGRHREIRWAPRVCDLDLIGAGQTILPDRETALEWMNLHSDAAMRQTSWSCRAGPSRLRPRACC